MTMLESVRQPVGIGLAATLTRVAAMDPYMATSLLDQPAAGWWRVSDLLAAPERWLEAELDQISLQYGVPDRKTAAIFFMGSYAWYVGAAALGCYLPEQRLPSLAADRVAIQFAAAASGGRMQVALLDPGFVALSGDPEAGAAASLAGDAQELRTLLRTRIEDHMRAMIELLSAHTRLGRRAQWNLVADACAELCLRLGQHMGRQEHACAEGLAIVKAADSPMRTSKTAYLTLAEGERCATFRLRGSCCMYYKTPAGANCATCPLLSGEEREARLRATLQPSPAA
jgi:hypothetical protein